MLDEVGKGPPSAGVHAPVLVLRLFPLSVYWPGDHDPRAPFPAGANKPKHTRDMFQYE